MNHDWTQEKERLKDILAQEEYQIRQEPESSNWLTWVLDRLMRWLEEHFNVSMPEGSSSTAAIIVIAISLLIIAGLIVWLVRQLWQQRLYRRRVAIEAEELDRPYPYYLERALELAHRGAYREGMRSAFLALLLYLQHRSFIKVEKWKTNWEYRLELGFRAPELGSSFAGAAVAFERAWYGKAEVQKEELMAYIDMIGLLLGKGKDNAAGT
ncbi:DUF4129 domain-containing protein [Paenibacillus sp. y28]|uniref:DUF4129 domain-containing protein n=1 Tax=Paenibacillus sp. y28 TaxID=3129110 RepID=UPI00301789F5